MERITIYLRTTKTSGKIKLRFRLTEGRSVQLFHKSDIEADLNDLKKFNPDGSLKPRITVYNEDLRKALDREIDAMREAYSQLKQNAANGTDYDAKDFELRIDMILNPDKYDADKALRKESLIERFRRYIDGLREFGTVAPSRADIYKTTCDKLERYLIITKRSRYLPENFTTEDIWGFRDFLINEYKYVAKYPKLYEGLRKTSVPQHVATQNTATAKLRTLQSFFNDLEGDDEIVKSPFRRLSRGRRNEVMREQYDEPYFLYHEEFQTILKAEVPESLSSTKDAFLLQCAIGCRISDFRKLTMDNIAVTEDGIPYVRYLPKKTMRSQLDRKEKTTPLMLFAVEIIKRTGLNFDVVRHNLGTNIYNKKIKELLEYCKINRIVSRFNEASGTMERVSLCSLGCSKLCRKTHIDMASKVQVNMYATGHHSIGSSAVGHYSVLEIRDLFILLCAAFRQPQFRVDSNLNVISELDTIL